MLSTEIWHFFLIPLLSLRERFRVYCHWLCNHGTFGNIILFCIMFSSAMLAAEDPMRADSYKNQVSWGISIRYKIYRHNLELSSWLIFLLPSARFSPTSTSSSPAFSRSSCRLSWFLTDSCYIKAPFAVRHSTCSIYSLSVYRSLVSSLSKSNNRPNWRNILALMDMKLKCNSSHFSASQLGKDLFCEDSSCFSCAETPESYQPCQRTEGIYAMSTFSFIHKSAKKKLQNPYNRERRTSRSYLSSLIIKKKKRKTRVHKIKAK